MSKFKVGEAVRFIAEHDTTIKYHATGIITSIKDDEYMLKLDHPDMYIDVNKDSTSFEYPVAEHEIELITPTMNQDKIKELENIIEDARRKIQEMKAPERTYKVGDHFTIRTQYSIHHVMLCQVGEEKYCLIEMETGNRWDNPVTCKTPGVITLEELNILAAGDYITLR